MDDFIYLENSFVKSMSSFYSLLPPAIPSIHVNIFVLFYSQMGQ